VTQLGTFDPSATITVTRKHEHLKGTLQSQDRETILIAQKAQTGSSVREKFQSMDIKLNEY
jgi:hypothetical protein